MVAELFIWNNDESPRERESLRSSEEENTIIFDNGMLSIDRQIGSEDPRLWMLIHRTIDFTVPLVQQVI